MFTFRNVHIQRSESSSDLTDFHEGLEKLPGSLDCSLKTIMCVPGRKAGCVGAGAGGLVEGSTHG